MNKLSILKKYSLKRLHFIEPEDFEGIIEFTVDGRTTIKKGAYLSTNQFDLHEQAHRYLAITFSPKFVNIFELQKIDLNEIELVNPYLDKAPTRVWPAFGLHGGGCEIILIKGKIPCKDSQEKFPHGGSPDPFHQDSSKADKIFVSQLAEMLLKWLEVRKDEYPEKQNPAMKIIDGLGVVISWLGSPSYKQYAISCAYKKDKASVRLRFWGYVWDDNEGDNKRILSKAEVKNIHIDYSLEELRKRISQGEDPKGRIENILSEIHERLIPIARNFHNYDNDTVELPPFVPLCYW